MKNPSILLAALCACLFAACGGGSSSGHDSGAPAMPAPPAPPAPLVDAFTSSVRSASMAAPDDAEPSSIDAIVATAPEDAEPVDL